MPFVATLLPLVGLQFLDSLVFELGIIGLGLGFGAYSVRKGYLKVHHNANVVILFVAGAILLLTGVLAAEEPLEIWLVVLGAVLVGGAQILNLRVSHNIAHAEGACAH